MPELRQSLTDHVVASQVFAPQAINKSTTVATAYVDMKDYDCVDFFLSFGAKDSKVDAKLRECDVSSGGAPSDIASGAITQIPAATATLVKVLSLKKETMSKRYALVSITTDGTGAAANYTDVIAVRYRKTGSEPVTQDATVTERVKV